LAASSKRGGTLVPSVRALDPNGAALPDERMILHHLRLVSFRAHRDTSVELTEGINLFFGPNGAGKTNLLEAAHYSCLTKSFLTARDVYALRKGDPFFEVEGAFSGRSRPSLRTRVVFAPTEGKRVFVNGAPLERHSELVGQLPVVVSAPGDLALTAEGPEERRRFLDNILSQSRPVYLDDLMTYRRVLRQRNVLLTRYRRSTPPAGLLESWDAELVAVGSRIVASRRRFVMEFGAFLEEAYRLIEAVGERPELSYDTVADVGEADDPATVATRFEEALAGVARRERELGRTLVGPHHDELTFRLDGLEVRRFASQGQHRLFALALRMAQYFYIGRRLEEQPLLLLDDLFGNLDERRVKLVMALLQSDAVGQSLVTATGRSPYDRLAPFAGPPHTLFAVCDGRVARVPA
jgi:DNA replication and repair protein RecF